MPACLHCGLTDGRHFDGCKAAPTVVGSIIAMSTRRAYVVTKDADGIDRVRETRDAGFYDPPPAIGDTLVRLADGTLSHKPARSATQNDDMPICGPERLGDGLDRLAQTLAEREREW
ncbi:hypothetical protein TSH7_01330 [Azospirillum sp. TSH7]|uniref:hypothetical protein n=1 Tax=unclassified Azospirillum TaxID=2630922 RepID=UPI000D610DC2|nr:MULTISPECIES: hypothetical protein [unclassified Azospirillum]PWC69114.1 hypothetical protein TSH7_01330 [Azospirillum sp. TSH7]PWC71394.1 hypothetical protein TSH20_03745 [Azospirillum sp. TSH20]